MSESEGLSRARLGEPRIVCDCVICKRQVILLARRDHVLMPENNSTLLNVCEECHQKYLVEGTMLINPNNGNLIVLKDEAFARIFNAAIPPRKIAFTDDECIVKIQSMIQVSQAEEAEYEMA